MWAWRWRPPLGAPSSCRRYAEGCGQGSGGLRAGQQAGRRCRDRAPLPLCSQRHTSHCPFPLHVALALRRSLLPCAVPVLLPERRQGAATLPAPG